MTRVDPTAVRDGEMRTLSIVRQIETAPGMSSSWSVTPIEIERSKQGGRPKRRR